MVTTPRDLEASAPGLDAQSISMDDEILSPLPSGPSDVCPNAWVDSHEGLIIFLRNARTLRQMSQLMQPNQSTSSKDQLVSFIYLFFKNMGLRRCESQNCRKFRTDYYRVVPTCRWTQFRDLVVVWSSCWMRAAKQRALSYFRSALEGKSRRLPGQ